jgi:signal transduction histidine kinase
MSWVTVIWSMGAAVCFALSALYFLVWSRHRTDHAHLLFAVTAAAFGVYGFFELRLLLAPTPQAMDAVLRWAQLPTSVALLSLMWFVATYLDAGRRWLAWTICGVRAVFALPNLVMGGNPNLLEIPKLEHIQFAGEPVAIIKGTPNPWALMGTLTLLLILAFVVDATITAWRRGDRRKAVMIGGAVALFLSISIMTSVLGLWSALQLPTANSLYYLILVAAMGYELSRDLLRASQLGRELQASQSDRLAILRAVPDLMFLQTKDGVYLDHHATNPGMLFMPPEQFLGRNMREVLPPAVLALIEPSFRRAATASEPIVIDYELPMPDGRRHYEARLVRSDNDQILTLVRDVTEARRAEMALRESEAILQASHREIRDLAGRLIAAQEGERARIGRELHDDLSQQIAGLSIALSRLKRRVTESSDPDLQADFAILQQRTAGLADNIRRLSHDLHPSVLQHAGLVATLSDHCAQVGRQQRIAISFAADGDFSETTAATALCLYRVTQEALRNVVTHAAAATADVRLRRVGDDVELTIADDGKGFDIGPAGPTGQGLGLISINERVRLVGGNVSIFTEVNKGTRVKVHVPLTALSPVAH